eukprot:16443841-Heterocapsa_arctica.AAC.1
MNSLKASCSLEDEVLNSESAVLRQGVRDDVFVQERDALLIHLAEAMLEVELLLRLQKGIAAGH